MAEPVPVTRELLDQIARVDVWNADGHPIREAYQKQGDRMSLDEPVFAFVLLFKNRDGQLLGHLHIRLTELDQATDNGFFAAVRSIAKS